MGFSFSDWTFLEVNQSLLLSKKLKSLQSRRVYLELSTHTRTRATVSRLYLGGGDLSSHSWQTQSRVRLCGASGYARFSQPARTCTDDPCNSQQKAHCHSTIRGSHGVFNLPLCSLPEPNVSAPLCRCLSQRCQLFMATGAFLVLIHVLSDSEHSCVSHPPTLPRERSAFYYLFPTTRVVLFAGGRWFGCYDARERET